MNHSEDSKVSLADLTKEEKSLLLYLETRAVDQWGVVDTCHMNDADMEIAEKWNSSGFVQFGRIKYNDIKGITQVKRPTHWCILSQRAWELAHEERRARAVRCFEKRAWRKSSE